MPKKKKKQKTPLVSVVLPVYNAGQYISEAIRSILNQTFTDFELIVINDGSGDSTLEIIQKCVSQDARIILINNEKNLKLSRSLNKGIERACGKYIARMDADDISYPVRLELQVDFMEKNPEVGIVGGSMDIMDENGVIVNRRDYASDDKILRQRSFMYSPFCHPAIMIRKSVLEKSGLYDPVCNPAEDLDLYFRVGLYSKFSNLSEALLKYRVVPDSMTNAGLRGMELKSIRIRRKYFNSPRYNASTIDRLYNLLHFVSVYTVPYKVKMHVFSMLRDRGVT